MHHQLAHSRCPIRIFAVVRDCVDVLAIVDWDDGIRLLVNDVGYSSADCGQ